MIQRIFVIIYFLLLSVSPKAFAQGPSNGGKWKFLKRSIGISAMHVALFPSGRHVAFDRTDFGRSNISLPAGLCRDDKNDTALRHDCSAHSIEFDPLNRAVRPLMVHTDTWCSSGALLPDGTLMQTGGFGDGERVVRYLSPCEGCDWSEDPNGLSVKRWYATNHILPDGRVIVVGGRRQFSYEFVPKREGEQGVYALPFLRETSDQWENNLYPFVHLSTNGNLFIFANTKSILLDYKNNKIVRTYPEIPGGIVRNYPSTGSSVLLPIWLNQNSNNLRAEVMICGGTFPNSMHLANGSNIFIRASNTCGRITITDESPKWIIEQMPIGRVMGDMVLLPTGQDVLIINGVSRGSAGWKMGREPVLNPVLYKIDSEGANENPRFEVMNPTKIPRVYHSTAQLMVDGRVLVGGSNPNVFYEFSDVMFPTELSLEAFSPPYVGSNRPIITRVSTSNASLHYGEKFSVQFIRKIEELKDVKVTMVAPTFTTHSFSMSQRVLVLNVEAVREGDGLLKEIYTVDVFSPASADVAPPGYYMVFVVSGGVPSRGKWVQLLQP